MNNLDEVLNEFAARVAALVVERLQAGAPGMLDQNASALGRRRHCAAVKRRLAAGETGAAIVGRQHLLSPEALAEELGRTSNRKSSVHSHAAGVRAELERELRLVPGGPRAGKR